MKKIIIAAAALAVLIIAGGAWTIYGFFRTSESLQDRFVEFACGSDTLADAGTMMKLMSEKGQSHFETREGATFVKDLTSRIAGEMDVYEFSEEDRKELAAMGDWKLGFFMALLESKAAARCPARAGPGPKESDFLKSASAAATLMREGILNGVPPAER